MAGENSNDQAAALLAGANEKVQALTAERDALNKENEVLTKERDELREENELLTAVNDELQTKVEELSSPKTIKEAIEKKSEKLTVPTDSFEVDGVKYKFISPVFVHKKTRVVAADALNNEELLKELVQMGSTLIAKA